MKYKDHQSDRDLIFERKADSLAESLGFSVEGAFLGDVTLHLDDSLAFAGTVAFSDIPI